MDYFTCKRYLKCLPVPHKNNRDILTYSYMQEIDEACFDKVIWSTKNDFDEPDFKIFIIDNHCIDAVSNLRIEDFFETDYDRVMRTNEQKQRENVHYIQETLPTENRNMISELELLERYPQISKLIKYISDLHFLAGTFTYVSKKDRSSSTKYEKIDIAEVKFNTARNRIEIKADNNERYIIFLKLEKNHQVYTDFTWDGYIVFHLCDTDEVSLISHFKQVVQCDEDRCEEKCICTLNNICPHQGEKSGICTYIGDDNKCAFRQFVRELK